MNAELENIEDLFENEEMVVTKATYTTGYARIVNLDVGVKDSEGDITEVITVKTNVIRDY